MKTLIVGGSESGPSSVVRQLSKCFVNSTTYNGQMLPKKISGFDLTIWMPQIDNSKPKAYPVKDVGSTLICSKKIRGATVNMRAEAVARIFRMQANAVIAIYDQAHVLKFKFELIDALNNTWCCTDNIETLAMTIMDFYQWNASQIRMSYQPAGETPSFAAFNKNLLAVNTHIANRIERTKGRFFGNLSTRCEALFPSQRYLFSRRNVDKRRLGPKDCVLVVPPSYFGDHKPSVDTPVQVKLYEQFPEIKYMIHGHAFIKGAGFTQHYYPCGDLREVNEIRRFFAVNDYIVNLKNHGFLIAATSISELVGIAKNIEFVGS